MQIKTILTLLLLVPSLCWGNDFDYLKKQINYIYKDLNTKQIDSYDAYFYVEQLSDAFEPWMFISETCYKALIKNTSNEVYNKINACLLYKTAFGYSSEEKKSNAKKFLYILNILDKHEKSEQFYLDKSDIDKFNENYANIFKAITLMDKLENLAMQIKD